MATTVLQRAKSLTTAAGTTTNTATLPGASTVGATQILLVGTTTGSSTVTATGWTVRSSDTTQTCNSFVYDRAVTTTAQTSATITYASGGSALFLIEVSGLTAFDKAATKDLATGSATTLTSTSITTVAATSYVASFVCYDTNTPLVSFSTPVALVDQGAVTGVSSIFHAGYGEGLASPAAAYTTTETSTAAAAGIEMHIAAWQGSAGVTAFHDIPSNWTARRRAANW